MLILSLQQLQAGDEATFPGFSPLQNILQRRSTSKQLSESLLKKANLLRSTVVFVFNLAAQRYIFASI